VLARLSGANAVATRLLEEGLEQDLVEAVLAENWTRVEELVRSDPSRLEAIHPIGGGALFAAGRCGIREMYRLRALGSDPDAPGAGFTPARGAIDCVNTTEALYSTTELLSNGADVNAPQRTGSSILHGAVLRQDLELVRLALRKGGDVTARNDAGETALKTAQRIGWDAGVALLRNHESVARDHRSSRFAFDAHGEPIKFQRLDDVSRADQSAVTSSSHGNLQAVERLLSDDPRKVFSISTDDELAIEACAHTGNRPIIRTHLKHGAPYSLPTAVVNGDLAFALFLLDDDPLRIHERGAHDFPVLWYAALGGDQVELAEALIDRGTPVDQESAGTTTLHLCAARGRPDLARFLISQGADIHARGYGKERLGQTPLQAARARGNTELEKLLLAAGAER